MAFTCQVCFEEKDQRLPLNKLATGNGDILRSADCQHPICQACLATFVATRVQEQFVFNVRCPFEGCVNELFEQDVTRLVGAGAIEPSVSERFAELRARDYTARAQSLSEELTDCKMAVVQKEQDLDLLQTIWQTTRLCPRCSLIIERSHGCNSFYCICGHHFDYATAPRVFGNHIRRYSGVIDVARTLRLSLQDAERYGGDARSLGKAWTRERALAAHCHVSRIAREARLGMDDAWQLYQQAASGDKDAQRQIRAARGRTEDASQVQDEEEENEAHCMDIVAGSPSQEERHDDALEEAQNGTELDANAQEELRRNAACEGEYNDDTIVFAATALLNLSDASSKKSVETPAVSSQSLRLGCFQMPAACLLKT